MHSYDVEMNRYNYNRQGWNKDSYKRGDLLGYYYY